MFSLKVSETLRDKWLVAAKRFKYRATCANSAVARRFRRLLGSQLLGGSCSWAALGLGSSRVGFTSRPAVPVRLPANPLQSVLSLQKAGSGSLLEPPTPP